MQALGSKLQLPWSVTQFHGKQVKESFLHGSIWHQESGPITKNPEAIEERMGGSDRPARPGGQIEDSTWPEEKELQERGPWKIQGCLA